MTCLVVMQNLTRISSNVWPGLTSSFDDVTQRGLQVDVDVDGDDGKRLKTWRIERTSNELKRWTQTWTER